MTPAWNCALKLPTVPESAVFQAIVTRLTRDPTLSRIFGPESWHLFSGDAGASGRPPARTAGPEVWIFPSAGASTYWSPGSQVVPLFLNFDLSVPSTCSLDVLNLWGAIRKAIFTCDFANDSDFRTSLQALGAHSGVITFSQAAYDPNPEDDGTIFRARGQIKIDIRLNT
jgi:hypothetical protein